METESPPDGGFDGAQARADTDIEEKLLGLSKEAERTAMNFARQNWRNAWEQSYKAFRSEYTDNSKYKSDDYRHRSKLFRPKTRIAMVKDLGAAAQSLFSTVEAVSVTPGDETDQMQVANAELQKALLNYRLDRTSGKNAIPWFLVSMGAREDSQITGICVSKQYWSFQRKTKTLPDGSMQKVTVKDKPEIELIAPENVLLDPAASWVDPVNSGAFFGVRYPMHVQDVKAMAKDPRTPWKEIEDKDFSAAKVRDFDSSSTRRAREGGTDRLDNSSMTTTEFDVVWVYEWFVRTEEEDYCFWTLGTEIMLSIPVETEKAYPWKGGERPYRIGYGNLEAHRIVPQSPVETWNPLQQELNDITNLRLDMMKQVLQPVAKVKRGKKIDTEALKRRYPVLFVDNVEDVEWDRPPDTAASAFAETSRIDTDMDDLAGVFSGGSVANNRQVGETVGGMRMMSAASNAVTEFQIRIWVETWVEPVLADLAKLEAYYESDSKILGLAKKRASLMQRFGVDELTDEFLSQEVLIRVSAGVGSPDPMQKLQKLGQAMQLGAQVFAGSKRFQSGALQIKEEALLNEIFGMAGFRDAFDRFFEEGEPMAPPGEAPQQEQGMDPVQLQDRREDRQSREKIAREGNKTKLATTMIQHSAAAQQQKQDQGHSARAALAEYMMEGVRHTRDAGERELDRKAAQRKQAA